MEFLIVLGVGLLAVLIVGGLALLGFNIAMELADEFDFSGVNTVVSGIIGVLLLPSLCYFLGRLILGA